MVPDLLEEHRGDRKDDHPAHAEQPVAGIKRQQRQDRVEPHLLADEPRLEGLPAERGRTVEHHEADARLRLPAQKQHERPRDQDRPRAEHRQRVDHRDDKRREQRIPHPQHEKPHIQDQERDPHQLQLRPQPAAERRAHMAAEALQLFQPLRAGQLLQPGADGRQLAGEHEARQDRRDREQDRVRQPPDHPGGPGKQRLIELRAEARAILKKRLHPRTQPLAEPIRQLFRKREQPIL